MAPVNPIIECMDVSKPRPRLCSNRQCPWDNFYARRLAEALHLIEPEIRSRTLLVDALDPANVKNRHYGVIKISEIATAKLEWRLYQNQVGRTWEHWKAEKEEKDKKRREDQAVKVSTLNVHAQPFSPMVDQTALSAQVQTFTTQSTPPLETRDAMGFGTPARFHIAPWGQARAYGFPPTPPYSPGVRHSQPNCRLSNGVDLYRVPARYGRPIITGAELFVSMTPPSGLVGSTGGTGSVSRPPSDDPAKSSGLGHAGPYSRVAEMRRRQQQNYARFVHP